MWQPWQEKLKKLVCVTLVEGAGQGTETQHTNEEFICKRIWPTRCSFGWEGQIWDPLVALRQPDKYGYLRGVHFRVSGSDPENPKLSELTTPSVI
jgi:hypothetical protein